MDTSVVRSVLVRICACVYACVCVCVHVRVKKKNTVVKGVKKKLSTRLKSV